MNESIRLAPPGGGLPKIELFFAKILFKIFLAGNKNYKLRVKALREKNLTVDLANSFPPESFNRPVLIPRITGIEDSSRNWSAAMTLQHLVITTTAMTDIAEKLIKGIRPSITVRIEDVKPSEAVAENILSDYLAAVDKLMDFMRVNENLKSELTHAHPWFGELDAHGWIGLTVMHLGIHRRQLGFIKALLPK